MWPPLAFWKKSEGAESLSHSKENRATAGEGKDIIEAPEAPLTCLVKFGNTLFAGDLSRAWGGAI